MTNGRRPHGHADRGNRPVSVWAAAIRRQSENGSREGSADEVCPVDLPEFGRVTENGGDLRVLGDGYSFLEVPRWHAGRLWVADLYAKRVLAVDEDGSEQTFAELPDEPSGLGWVTNDHLLVALMNERRIVQVGPRGVTGMADLGDVATARLNDLAIDPSGRAFIGNFGLQGGALIRVDPDGSARVVAGDLLLPNGSVVTPNGRTLIVAESAGQRLTAFDIHADGSLGRRRVWAAFGVPPTARTLPEILEQVTVWPDGIALDSDGAVWVANAFGNEVFRVREGGEVTDRISTGELSCCACALGGGDGRTLFLCAAPRAPERELRTRRAAKLLACRVSVPATESRSRR